MLILEHNKEEYDKQNLYDFINEINQDKHLILHEIKVQEKWFEALNDVGIINDDEIQNLLKTLKEIVSEILEDKFLWSSENEDMHMHIEHYVTKKLGDLGRKVSFGRSRNDLVATSLRLYCVDECEKQKSYIISLIKCILDQSEKHIDVIIPGLSHAQHGQPLRFSSVLMSYVQNLLRDLQSLKKVKDLALSNLPLGASAMSGTHLNVDLTKLAHSLGFKEACRNSYDSVGDRDFILQHLDALSLLSVHLSRMSSDFIYWMGSTVGILVPSNKLSTYSSIMPNKKNPEVAELTRSRAAMILSQRDCAYAIMRGLQSGYVGDIQDLKIPYIESNKLIRTCFSIWPEYIKGFELNDKRANELLGTGHILATNIAEKFVNLGTNFREAYIMVKNLIALADKQGKQVHEIDDESVKNINLSYLKSVEEKNNKGGTSKSQLLDEIYNVRSTLVG